MVHPAHSTGAGVDRTGILYVSQEPGKLLSAEPVHHHIRDGSGRADCFQRTGTTNEGAKARVGVKRPLAPSHPVPPALAVKARVQGRE
jgi:hypothetical protein